jgi:hypothetical protein
MIGGTEMAMSPRTRVAAPKAQASRPATADLTPPAEKVAQRAYQIWEASGRPDGQHEEHWLRAERELRAQYARN